MNIQSKKVHLASFVKINANLTRSEVIKLLDEKIILVNNQLMPLSYVILDSDMVTLDGVEIKQVPKVYYIYHKPKGLICTNNMNIENNIMNDINLEHKVFCVGRLDKDTRGLILLTNDGDFSNQIQSPNCKVEKEYVVRVKYPINEEFIKTMEKPIIIKGKITLPAQVKKIDDYSFRIILKDGKYHQIRRLVINAKNTVVDLWRIRIGKYELLDLKESEVKKISIN